MTAALQKSMPALPAAAHYVIIGAGIHGLSTAMHLAQKLAARGKTVGPAARASSCSTRPAMGAGASGIACGVVRNNYYQPAMRELMAHCVSVWESDAEAYSYHPVGYMQISPEVDARAGRHDLRAAEGDRLRVGVHRRRSRIACATCRACFARLAGEEHHLGAAREARRLREQHGVAARARGQGAGAGRRDRRRRRRSPAFAASGGTARHARSRPTPATIACDAGRRRRRPVDQRDLEHARRCRRRSRVKGRDGKMHDGVRMWHYMALQEGTLGVDPDYQKTNDGAMPPVIHVDTDAPLYSDRDGKLDHRQAVGHLLQAGLPFRRRAGRRDARGGRRPTPDEVRVDPYGPKSPEFVVTDNFADMWTSALALLPEAVRGPARVYRQGAVGRHRLLHARQLSRVRPLSRERAT